MGKELNEIPEIDEIAEKGILEFVNKFGLIGFINDATVNKRYILDKEVLLKTEYPFYKERNMPIIAYLKLFFPLLNNKQLNEKIENCKKILQLDLIDNAINERLNEELYYNDDYYETIPMIANYALNLFIVYCSVMGVGLDFNKEAKRFFYDYVKCFKVTNLNFDLAKANDNKTIKIRWEISSLKQMIDTYFALILSSDINSFKVCKYCHKVFIAKNPKAEYCSPQCRNRANVYKSRAKNSHS